ncbi:TetR/AcrR family transcriptional regulator [Planobispora longispora]|uniref:Putative transcriptional regulator, TetR family protein n=1 Tax=Planobispora longispora TaxID=28887 RepID=A0A8J3RNL8_9ACTN|nr:TetR/AcrR family transcriptional regulator [Planobispora longispora]GIH77067.1 putative transcriptional regulator, TetR family protein [Planobispora longispora]
MTSSTSSARPYRGMPAEQRRAQRRAALLEAGLEVLGRHGWAAATVRGVCKQAGLNDRYFYESFTDLDALLLAVVDDQAARGTAVILAAASAAPHRLRARARAVVEAIVDFLSADPRRGRVLAHEFSAHPLLQQRRRRIIRTLAAIFTAQVHELLDEVPLSATDLHLTALTVTAGLWDLLTDWFRGDLDTGRDHLIDYVVAFLLTTTELAPALQHRLQ